MRKICVVITARTSYTKIKPILYHLNKKKSIKLQIVLAASAVLDKYGKVDDIVKKDGFPVDEKIYMLIESESLLNTSKSLFNELVSKMNIGLFFFKLFMLNHVDNGGWFSNKIFIQILDKNFFNIFFEHKSSASKLNSL